MNKRFIVALLSMCLLLSACGAEPLADETEPTAQTQGQENGNTEPSIPTEETARGPVFEKIPSMEDHYQYGNMQKNIPSGDFLLYNDKVLFDAVSGRFLYAYDLRTGTVQPFCGKEKCDHSGSACLRIQNHGDDLEQYGGTLYGQDNDHIVKSLVDGEWTALVKGIRRFWHGDGDLFTVNWKWELQIRDDGTGEPRTILEDYDYYWNTVFDGYLYGAKDNELIRVDLHSEDPVKETVLENAFPIVEGNHIYYVDCHSSEKTYHLYRCDMDGTNSQLLLDKPVLPASINFDDEYFYFRLFTDGQIDGTADGYDIYRMSKTDPTQVEKIATLPETAYQIYTVPGLDILFVVGRSYYNEHKAQRENIYVMNTDGSNLTQLTIPGY